MSSRERRQRFDQVIEPVVTGLGLEYVGCDFLSQGNHTLLRVYIDSPTGVNVDACTSVSRQLSAVLDVEDLISGRYNLEVSSPGLERPLFTIEHFQQFIGKRAYIRMSIPLEQQSNFTGELLAVQEGNILLGTEKGEVTLPFAGVSKAHLVYELSQKSMKRR